MVNYYCADCRTSVDKVTRKQHQASEQLSKQLFLTPAKHQASISKIIDELPLDNQEAMAIIRIFAEQASANIAAKDDNATTGSSELVAILMDVVDAVKAVRGMPATAEAAVSIGAASSEEQPAFPDNLVEGYPTALVAVSSLEPATIDEDNEVSDT